VHSDLIDKNSNIWLTSMVLVFRLAINFFKTYIMLKNTIVGSTGPTLPFTTAVTIIIMWLL